MPAGLGQSIVGPAGAWCQTGASTEFAKRPTDADRLRYKWQLMKVLPGSRN